ncbi:MAG: GAF domain-containing protein [Acidobacteria bacterium]|nr:GAF domain-containing protein [Acidobacteriota bacterium]
MATDDHSAGSDKPGLENRARHFAELTRRFHRMILRLATRETRRGTERKRVFGYITEQVSRALQVDRTGVWLFDAEGLRLTCADVFKRPDKRHEDGAILPVHDFPRYFDALRRGRGVDAADSRNDPRTCELSNGYLVPSAIASKLDAPVRLGGNLVGVVCVEQTGSLRAWAREEVDFVCVVADHVAQVISDFDRRKAEADLRLTEARLQSLYEISISPAENTQALLDFALDEAIRLTGSKIGYIYHYDEEARRFSLNSWSQDVMKECSVALSQNIHDLDRTGIWGEAVRQRRPILVNDFNAPNPLKKGYPDGHVKLQRFLTVPILTGDSIVAVVGVANKASDYDAADSRQLTLLMDAVWKIVEHRRTLEALRESEEKYRALHSSLSEGMCQYEIVRDSSGAPVDYRFLEVNPAFETILGVTAPEAVGRLASEFYRTTNPPYLDIYAQVAENGEPAHFEAYFPPLDRHFAVAVFSPRQGRFVTLFQDITERRVAEHKRLELERKFLLAQKMESLGILAGGVAHDFNNLMMAVTGNLELAMLDLGRDSRAFNNIRQALDATQRAASLTRQMLAYAGRGRFVLQPVNLGELFKEKSDLLRASVDRHVRLSLLLDSRVPPIEADPLQMEQVVINLLTNAAEAIGEDDGEITLKTGLRECDDTYLKWSRLEEKPPAGVYVVLEVSDTGCGMNAETRQHLFEPFFSTRLMGRGLGLPAVMGIVRSHMGAIMVDSEPGRGTTVTVLFPPVQAAVHDTAPVDGTGQEATAREGTAQGTILVVESEKMVREVCKRILEYLGYAVIIASSPQEAIEIFKSRRSGIDAVILDFTTPRASSLLVVARMREHQPDVRIILSSDGEEKDTVQGFGGQAHLGFVKKPYQIRSLKATLDRLLSGERAKKPPDKVTAPPK